MTKKYSSDKGMQTLFEGFRKFTLDEAKWDEFDHQRRPNRPPDIRGFPDARKSGPVPQQRAKDRLQFATDEKRKEVHQRRQEQEAWDEKYGNLPEATIEKEMRKDRQGKLSDIIARAAEEYISGGSVSQRISSPGVKELIDAYPSAIWEDFEQNVNWVFDQMLSMGNWVTSPLKSMKLKKFRKDFMKALRSKLGGFGVSGDEDPHGW
jgi:hypothetical protein